MTCSLRSLLVLGVVALLAVRAVVACSTDDAGAAPTGGRDADVPPEARLPAEGELVGTLGYGDTSAPVAYRSPPPFRAFSFHGDAGDAVRAVVRASTGGALAWLLDGEGRVLARDLSGAPEAQMSAALASSGTFFVLFREVTASPATFTVTLSGGAMGAAGDGGGGSPGDAGLPLADGGIRCVYRIERLTAGNCAMCFLPGPTMTVEDITSVTISDAGYGFHDMTFDGGKGNGRVVFLDASTLTTFGCENLKRVALDGVPPDESFHIEITSAILNVCGMTRGNVDASAWVRNGNELTVDYHLLHSLPSQDCPGVYGCSKSYVDCTGSVTATTR